MTKLAKKVIEEHCLSISKDDPKTTYELSLKPIWWKIVDSSDPKIMDLLSESDLSNLNTMFLSALKSWTVLEPLAEKCLKSLMKVNDDDLTIVRPKGTYGDILRLQEMLVNIRDPINLEADDGLFCDKCVNEDEKNFHKETPSLVLEDHLDPNIINEESSSRITKHDTDIANNIIYEQQNDLQLQELNDKLSTLHKITLDIHNDVNEQVNFLDDTGDSFLTFRGSLNGTVEKLKHMTAIRHQQYMCDGEIESRIDV
ncbi:2456_t:CDS:2 [Entrophospora sp. SA101]|nr:2456_t:CDS:2 [Entrophospora sp. SA101]